MPRPSIVRARRVTQYLDRPPGAGLEDEKDRGAAAAPRPGIGGAPAEGLIGHLLGSLLGIWVRSRIEPPRAPVRIRLLDRRLRADPAERGPPLDVCSTTKPCAGSRSDRGDQGPVVVVIEQRRRLADRQPAQLVDLVVRRELPAPDCGRMSHQRTTFCGPCGPGSGRAPARGRARTPARSPRRPRGRRRRPTPSPGSSFPFGSDQSP